MKLLRVMFVVMFGLCLVIKAQGAEAHSVFRLVHSGMEKSAAADSTNIIQAEALSNPASDDDGCKDGCCVSSMSCCVAMVPSSGDIAVYHEASIIVPLTYAPLPQGPPLTLLRPPKFTA